MQLLHGVRKKGLKAEVVHLVELLDRAYHRRKGRQSENCPFGQKSISGYQRSPAQRLAGGGDWGEFHTSYIVDLSRALKRNFYQWAIPPASKNRCKFGALMIPESEPNSDLTIYDTSHTLFS